MTPYQLSLIVQDYNEQKKEDQEEKLTLTYLGTYLQRVKKMPSLNKLIGKKEPKKKMTPEEILEQVRKMNEALGGTTF